MLSCFMYTRLRLLKGSIWGGEAEQQNLKSINWANLLGILVLGQHLQPLHSLGYAYKHPLPDRTSELSGKNFILTRMQYKELGHSQFDQ